MMRFITAVLVIVTVNARALPVRFDLRENAKFPTYGRARVAGQVPTPPWRLTPTVAALKRAILDRGPVMTAMRAKCEAGSVNQLMVLVGWDDREGTWIARSTWGSESYVRIAYDCNGIGSMAQYLEY